LRITEHLARRQDAMTIRISSASSALSDRQQQLLRPRDRSPPARGSNTDEANSGHSPSATNGSENFALSAQ